MSSVGFLLGMQSGKLETKYIAITDTYRSFNSIRMAPMALLQEVLVVQVVNQEVRVLRLERLHSCLLENR